MLATLLEGKYRVARSPKNYNSQIGLPLAILNHLYGDEDYLVQEMGMTAAGQISKLIEIAPPDMSVITYIALVHAAFFDGLDAIARAKAEIFALPATQVGFYPENIACRSIIEGVGSCTKRAVKMNGDLYPPLPFPGDHIRQNFLLAAAVARECGMSDEEITARIPSLQLPEKRQQFVVRNGVTFINDSYNACAPSIIAAFNALPHTQGKRIAVIGEMMELGSFSQACHNDVGVAALDKVDRMLCLGAGCAPIVEVWKKQGRPVDYFDERSLLVDVLKREMASGDVVLLKGSNSKQLWKILDEV
jgi:UDP-N-acetylmuramoyl-tripeptide--D-alanyl-D-alanine ligase